MLRANVTSAPCTLHHVKVCYVLMLLMLLMHLAPCTLHHVKVCYVLMFLMLLMHHVNVCYVLTLLVLLLHLAPCQCLLRANVTSVTCYRSRLPCLCYVLLCAVIVTTVAGILLILLIVHYTALIFVQRFANYSSLWGCTTAGYTVLCLFSLLFFPKIKSNQINTAGTWYKTQVCESTLLGYIISATSSLSLSTRASAYSCLSRLLESLQQLEVFTAGSAAPSGGEAGTDGGITATTVNTSNSGGSFKARKKAEAAFRQRPQLALLLRFVIAVWRDL